MHPIRDRKAGENARRTEGIISSDFENTVFGVCGDECPTETAITVITCENDSSMFIDGHC